MFEQEGLPHTSHGCPHPRNRQTNATNHRFSTQCFNQLDLPEYTSEEQTREKILMAIREGSEGFGYA